MIAESGNCSRENRISALLSTSAAKITATRAKDFFGAERKTTISGIHLLICPTPQQILGATSVAQLNENLKALDIVPKLTKEVMDRIDEAMETKPVLDDTSATVIAYRKTN